MDEKERLIDYLYGEMTETERREFEDLLSRDEELRVELNTLRQTRQQLAELPGIQPEATVVTIEAHRPGWAKWTWRAGTAVAVILLLALLNPRLEIGGNGLMLTLGNPSVEKEEVKAENVLAGFQAQLDKRDRELERKLLQLDTQWQNRLTEREERLQQNWDQQLVAYQVRRQQDLEQFAQYLVNREMPELVTLVQDLQLEQREELRLLLTQFWNQWQETRAADLESIETEFVNVYRNVELNQSETEAILQSIVASR